MGWWKLSSLGKRKHTHNQTDHADWLGICSVPQTKKHVFPKLQWTFPMVSKLYIVIAMCNQQAEKETNKLGLSSSDILGIASSQGWGTKATQLWSSPVHEWLSHGLADKHMRLHPCSFAFNWLVRCLDWILAHFLSTGFRTDKADVSYKVCFLARGVKDG